MEVVEVETPHAQQKLKVVAMEEVEDMRAHDSSEFDNEMKICNLDNIEIVEEGGGIKYLRGIKRAPDALSWITYP